VVDVVEPQLFSPANNCSRYDKNSSGDEIANANFYAVRPEATRIRWNNAKYAITSFKVIQGHRFSYQSKAHMRLPISAQ